MARTLRTLALALSLVVLAAPRAVADGTYHSLAGGGFAQNWSNAALIEANDDWDGVPSIIGYLGDVDAASPTGVDPQTRLTGTGVVDVIANQLDDVGISNGGVAEFDALADPVVALQGSGTADAPSLILHLDATGVSGLAVRYTLRDVEDTSNNSVQQVALHYRLGGSGDFVNVPAGYVADASAGPSATLETEVCLLLPAAVDGQAQLQVRFVTTNAGSSDEWIGIDDIEVDTAGCPITLSLGDEAVAEGDGAAAPLTFTVALDYPAGPGGVSFDIATSDGTAEDGDPGEDDDYVAAQQLGVTIAQGLSEAEFQVTVNADLDAESDETFTVTVSNVAGALVDDPSATGTILDDDTIELTVADVAVVEGDAGSSDAVFTVQLSKAAPPGGVTFDAATSDGSATTAGGDYDALVANASSIAEGALSTQLAVEVNADLAAESDETFNLTLSNVTGAVVVDAAAVGTIVDDDWTPIHTLQGAGASSPVDGSAVTTGGVVTGVTFNGFFLQTADAAADADPNTSEGLFVFTSAAPPATAAVGNLVRVSGTIDEFVPGSDPLQPPVTELVGPTVTLLAAGQPLPAPVALTAVLPDPAGAHDQLERLEGMRVSVAALEVVAPTSGSVSEASATATSNGTFYGVVPGHPRPLREPGIPEPDPAPVPLPRFDSNPERIRVETRALDGETGLDVVVGDTLGGTNGVIGPLHYEFRTYTIETHSGSSTLSVTDGGLVATPVTVPRADEVTVATYNLQRFYDTVNDPNSDTVLTPTAYDNRLAKASLAIRNYLLLPDVIGLVEIEKQEVAEELATRISADALAASQPDPLYEAHVVEGHDIGGIDVGFLVKTAPASGGGDPRVAGITVTQEREDVLWLDPGDNETKPLHDRPPLLLRATVEGPYGDTVPLTVMVNHLRSLNGNDDAVDGPRVREKRYRQARDIASLVQELQGENLVVVGDFNAFEFNDGYVDSMGTITGAPAPEDQTVVDEAAIRGAAPLDLVAPDLVNLSAGSYSYVFDGNAQSLDHVLTNVALGALLRGQRVEHARINADFPEALRGDPGTAVRLSDHDPVVTYLGPSSFALFADGFEGAFAWSAQSP